MIKTFPHCVAGVRLYISENSSLIMSVEIKGAQIQFFIYKIKLNQGVFNKHFSEALMYFCKL